MPQTTRILFLCGSNSCRPQIAEGFLRTLAGDKFEVRSAGATASFVHPLAIEVMAEVGIDISGQRSKSLDEFVGQEFDYVIIVCANDTRAICLFFPGKVKHRLNWGFDDPADVGASDAERLQVFRDVRDQIQRRIEGFLGGPL